eukprot:g59285.t1
MLLRTLRTYQTLARLRQLRIRTIRATAQLHYQMAPMPAMRTFSSVCFGSEKYAACFGDLPTPQTEELRTRSLEYMRSFNPQTWFDDPICTTVRGERLIEGARVKTHNAFQEENGSMQLATQGEVDQVIAHMRSFRPPQLDLRKPVRHVEQSLLHSHAHILVGNQALDFKKQDGLTEIEESVEANAVERRLNDLLLEDEAANRVQVRRNAALVGCVSNFSNFLDLFRKTIRNLELGVPVVVLSRSNTAQHSFRWFQLLLELLREQGEVDLGMLTFVACSIEEQRRIMSSAPESPLYFTGSRAVAAAIKQVCHKLMSSTGGPNTMVADVWSDSIATAFSRSACIEHSGQCTALRHLVAPLFLSSSQLDAAFGHTPVVSSPQEALEQRHFAALFTGQEVNVAGSNYQRHPSLPLAYISRDNQLPPLDLEEKWRQCYVDVSRFSPEQVRQPSTVDALSHWLNHTQPISLAVNGKDFPSAFSLAAPLFNRTCMVVYTVGAVDAPALTAQARPQDAEIFGEFPPRAELARYTRFPVMGPSSTPGYDSCYTEAYLKDVAESALPSHWQFLAAMLRAASPVGRGYCRVLLSYLEQAAQGPRQGYGRARTALWGLQRPPVQSLSILRAQPSTGVDEFLFHLLPFLTTNARAQLHLSLDPTAQPKLLEAVARAGLDAPDVVMENAAEFEASLVTLWPWNVIHPQPCDFSLVGHMVSTLFPLGHIKSTRVERLAVGSVLAYYVNINQFLLQQLLLWCVKLSKTTCQSQLVPSTSVIWYYDSSEEIAYNSCHGLETISILL